ALQTRDLLEAMRADAPESFRGGVEMRIDGGMSRSGWFGQRLADLTGVGVARATYQETTALGAALFAGLGAGLYSDIESAARVRPKTEDFAPRLSHAQREAAYARWLDAVARVRS
ncbi:MAG: glpK, partial [Phenylobacterium sp.]|nr:glpK [Phenylobacterium sp.]